MSHFIYCYAECHYAECHGTNMYTSNAAVKTYIFILFRFLYTNIHKKHHEWQSTVAYAAIYAHPVGKTVGIMQ